MIPHDARLHDPGAGLADEAQAYGALLETLQREQAALIAADAEGVAAAVAAKAPCIEALRVLAQRRAQALRRAGFAPDPTGMVAWIDRHGAAEHPRWMTVARLADKARALNLINGRLILTQQRHWDRALTALFSAAGRHATYGADGRPRHAVAGRALAAI
jgi:flagellar biosynthesis/type III secretory pathway chaperone